MSVTSYTADNLVTATEDLITDNVLVLESGESVVRGQVLKKGSTGLVAVDADADTPYTIALQTVDATSAAKPIEYMIEGSVMADSVVVSGTATVAGMKDKLRDVGILVF